MKFTLYYNTIPNRLHYIIYCSLCNPYLNDICKSLTTITVADSNLK